MIRLIINDNNKVKIIETSELTSEMVESKVLGIELSGEEQREKEQVEQFFNVNLLSWQEAEEIESSSRYFETDDSVTANSSYLMMNREGIKHVPVSFIIQSGILVSYIQGDTDTFRLMAERLRARSIKAMDGASLFLVLLDVRIDYDADVIEGVGRHINELSRRIRLEKNTDEDQILEITQLQETTMLLRENAMDKQRTLSSMMKSHMFIDKSTIRIMLKDTGSLLAHTAFSFERLEFLQDTLMGLIDIEQNKIIKMFSVVAVVFMPPTLIASVYGMNFRLMPELSWQYGYLVAIALMIASSLITLWFFRRKGWL